MANQDSSLLDALLAEHRFFREHERHLAQMFFVAISGLAIATVWCYSNESKYLLPLSGLTVVVTVFGLITTFCLSRQHCALVDFAINHSDSDVGGLFRKYKRWSSGKALLWFSILCFLGSLCFFFYNVF